ncbi:MAG: NAD(P)H-dependent oxidoreductase subunit E [Bacteroidales bacterium]|jgi:NADH-quinone oxidoreductase subunit E|nr:NAD(P)H-dependent oxidoreductase subunit E [Bacteroidales bacterium]
MSKDIEVIIKKYKPGRREELIPLLQEIQDEQGHLSEEAIVRVGNFVGLSTTKIYGLATFYDQFKFVPSGKVCIKICNGTSCFLNGSQAVMNKIREETGLPAGQTSRDGSFSYEIVTCMGGCNNGPVISVNGEYNTYVKPEQLSDLIRRLKFIIEND